MSALEIFEQFKVLPVREQQEFKILVDDYCAIQVEEGDDVMPDGAFQHAKKHVFANYGPLLEQLAK